MICKVIFRYDDLSYSIKPIDEVVATLFNDFQVKLSIGFIPFLAHVNHRTLPSLFLSPYIEPIIHGHAHVKFSVKRKYLFSEFANRPYLDQFNLIKDSKAATEEAFLQSIYSFIPPWNSYDMHTIDALINNEITNLSARVHVTNPSSNHIQFIPATCNIGEFYEYMKKRKLQFNASSPSIIVVNFHSYEIKESMEIPEYKCRQISVEQLHEILTFMSGHRNSSLFIKEAGNTGYFNGERYKKNIRNVYTLKSMVFPFNKYLYL